MLIEYRTQTFYQIPIPPIIVCLQTFSTPSPLGGDTPFYAFGYEIKDFYLTRKKTGRRYGRLVKFVLRYCLYACVYLYLMRRDVARRYKQRNHIQQ